MRPALAAGGWSSWRRARARPSRRWQRGRGVIASERLLFARDCASATRSSCRRRGACSELPIVGAFRDFNTGEPAVVLSLERYPARWDDDGLTRRSVSTLARKRRAAAVESAVRSLLGQTPGSRALDRAARTSCRSQVFDRTFKVTEVLRVLAGIVAFLGVLSALLAIELERARELGVLRTLGFTPGGLGATLLTQTGLLGLAAGLAAMPIGIALAALLVHVINRRSFGWSMDFVVTPQALVAGCRWRWPRRCSRASTQRGARAASISARRCGRIDARCDGSCCCACAVAGRLRRARSEGRRPPHSNTGLRYLGGERGDGFARATAPREFVFPADHGSHPEYPDGVVVLHGQPRDRRPAVTSASSSRSFATRSPPCARASDGASAWRTRAGVDGALRGDGHGSASASWRASD